MADTPHIKIRQIRERRLVFHPLFKEEITKPHIIRVKFSAIFFQFPRKKEQQKFFTAV